MSGPKPPNPWASDDPHYPIRLIPCGDEIDVRRDDVNAEAAEQIDRLAREYEATLRSAQTTTDPALKHAYAEQCRRLDREKSLLERDILVDWIARLEKWDRLRPERHWKLVEHDRETGDIRCYHFSSGDNEDSIRESRHHNRDIRILQLQQTEEPPPDWRSDVEYSLRWEITATNPLTGDTRTHNVVGPSLADVWEQVKASGYIAECHAVAEGLEGEYPEPWSTFRIIGINPRTKRKKRFETYARDYYDAVRRFRHRGIKVVEWLRG